VSDSTSSSVSLNGLARQLIAHGTITEETAMQAATKAETSKTSFLMALTDVPEISTTAVAQIIGSDFGLPVFDLSRVDYESLPQEFINEELITQQNAVPIMRRGSKLFVAISDPTNSEPLDKYKFTSGLSVEAIVVEEHKLAELRSRVAEGSSALTDDLDESFDLDVDNPDEGVGIDDDDDGVDETPIVRYVNKVLLDAIKRGASDIHVEPYEKMFRIRYRVDGVLEEVANPPLAMAGRLTSRLKVMSRMDISERRVPQDGRIKLKISKTKAIDFRVNTCPTLFGEKTVLRILDPSSASLGIDMLGYEPEQKQLYMDALANPYGMILVTGPTGSGKTVSLYTGLNILNEPGTNISTAEDPAEINLAGINQVNMNPKAGLTFAEALKSFLRQDPDIIMVGEIRDLETAEIAIKAAQTAFNIASAVSLIIAQRLGRRLCEHCKELDDIPREILLEEGFREDQLEGIKLYKPVGCNKCNNGYKGRVGIYQVMKISEAMSRIIMDGGNALDIADQAQKEKINDLRQSALLKAMQGLMGLEEANRVTKE